MQMRFNSLLLLFFVSSLMVSWSPNSERWLLVIHAQSGKIERDHLYLDNSNKLVAAFKADPGQEGTTMRLHYIVNKWEEIFPGAPPRAALTTFTKDGELQETIVILHKPALDNSYLSFEIIEEGRFIDMKLGESVLFIDSPKEGENLFTLPSARRLKQK